MHAIRQAIYLSIYQILEFWRPHFWLVTWLVKTLPPSLNSLLFFGINAEMLGFIKLCPERCSRLVQPYWSRNWGNLRNCAFAGTLKYYCNSAARVEHQRA